MNIYLSSSTQSDPTLLESIKSSIIASKHTVKQNVLNGGRKPEEIFQQNKDAIDGSDAVVAEVSGPSIAVGGEIVYALMRGKPVLALFYKDAQNTLTPMIAGNPSDNLYIEHYEEDNIGILLKNFFSQVSCVKDRKGKLIVIDGGDGSGKATQSDLLKTSLESKGMKVKYMDFPRYYRSFHGRVVGRFLTGEFGSLEAVSPYLASLAYALDRASAKDEMDEWLSAGGIVLANRYATSSMAHQAAKLPEEKRKEFIEWLDEMEYKVHKIPREDIVIYLYVPWKVGYDLTLQKTDRGYMGGAKLDIAEADLNHRKFSEEMYLELAKTRKNWVKIDCVDAKGKILPKEEIHQKIIAALREKKIIE